MTQKFEKKYPETLPIPPGYRSLTEEEFAALKKGDPILFVTESDGGRSAGFNGADEEWAYGFNISIFYTFAKPNVVTRDFSRSAIHEYIGYDS
jgi:hypothetical protein